MITLSHLFAAFFAGLISFFAPCLLPLFPSYFSVITGFTFSELYGLNFTKIRRRIIISSLFFIAGFTLVFTLLGATGFIIGKLIEEHLPFLLRLSGIFLGILGLIQLGIVKIPSLRFDYAWNVQRKLSRLGYATAVITGIASALSWIPCVGPLLSPILLLAAGSETAFRGSLLLFVYSLGITFPFMLASLYFPRVVQTFTDNRVVLHRISQLAGIVLIAFGLILFFNQYAYYIEVFNVSSSYLGEFFQQILQ